MSARPGSLVARALPILMVLAAAGCDENILNPMADRQPRAKAYKESAFFADGLSMRAAPDGTVPRGRITHNRGLTRGRTADTGPVQMDGDRTAAYVTTIPVTVTPQLLAVGRKRFDIVCATCHGPAGDGDSIVARQMALRPPPSLHEHPEHPAGYFFEIMTKGFGLMASYAAELNIEERWAVVAYIRALQLSQNVPIDQAPPEIRARLMAEPPSPSAPPRPSAPAHKETR